MSKTLNINVEFVKRQKRRITAWDVVGKVVTSLSLKRINSKGKSTEWKRSLHRNYQFLKGNI